MQEGESSSREVRHILEDCLPFRSGKRSIQHLTRVCINGSDQIVRGFLPVVTCLQLSYRQPPDSFELSGKREVYLVVMAVERSWICGISKEDSGFMHGCFSFLGLGYPYGYPYVVLFDYMYLGFLSSLIELREQIIQRLGQRRMRKDAIAQDGIGDFPHHRHFQDGHDLAAFDAQDGSTENLARIAIHHRFHETSGLVHF